MIAEGFLALLLWQLGTALPQAVARTAAECELGAVASEKLSCSNIGANLLRAGGSAADAIVGTVFCVGVQGMYHSGIGGGGFATLRAPNGSYEMIDFRETAPAAAFQDMYSNDTDLSLYGGLASGVPGELRGMQYIHENYGKLPWATVMQPAIELARFGFPVTEDLVNYINEGLESAPTNFLIDDPSWAIDFAPNGTLVQLNDTMYRKRYADTLETIANYGPDAFYGGAIANATIAALQSTGGTMTLEDLANYTVAIRKPAEITYRDFKITSCAAPSGGEVALSILKILEGYPEVGSPAAINMSTFYLNEAMRFAYGQRTNLGDPEFVVGLYDYENAMLSEQTVDEVHSKITDVTHNNISYYDPGQFSTLSDHGTSEITAADASGLTITLTTTVNLLFGSEVMIPETGVIMNDEMNDFSIPGSSNAFGYRPSPANYIVPGKRPLSSISPTIAEWLANGTVYLATGSAGGSQIITAVAQTVWHVLDQGMSIAMALAQPRLHDQLSPNRVQLEYTYNNETAEFLRSRGSNVTYTAPGGSTAQGLLRLTNGTFTAAGEPRQHDSGGVAV
ncbi:MAG: hypothetical protein Q9162_002251 [Coniocarpon cinnabarinum]